MGWAHTHSQEVQMHRRKCLLSGSKVIETVWDKQGMGWAHTSFRGAPMLHGFGQRWEVSHTSFFDGSQVPLRPRWSVRIHSCRQRLMLLAK
eukprot:70439-Pelagomonas_calceolata.AAC.1